MTLIRAATVVSELTHTIDIIWHPRNLVVH
jgi:hypothetical protein